MERRRKVVKVTRNGQVTIPKDLRDRFGVREGSLLVAKATGEGVLLSPVPTLEDLGGSLAKYTSLEKLRRELDRSREDED